MIRGVIATDIHRTIDAVWRIESAKLIGALARMMRDISVAEDLAQDALVAALEQWPQSGVPDNPGAWLMATAKRRAIDQFRRNQMLDRKHQQLGYELESNQSAESPTSRHPLRRTLATTYCAWSSWHVIPCSPPKRESR